MCDGTIPDDECEEFEQDVSLEATFDFPGVLTEHVVMGKHLIIAPEQANWLVCDDNEYAAFQLLREGKSVQQAIDQLTLMGAGPQEVVSSLLAQILGKEFLQDARVGEKPPFTVASLYLTAGCNLRCTTCLWSATVAGTDECSLDHWKRFIKAFKDFGGEIAVFTGGEPMTNPDCLAAVRYAKTTGLKVVLLTNGTLVTEHNARILGDCCDEIQISIDGPTAEISDSIRGQGTFGKAMSALQQFSLYPNCHLSIAMTPTPDTLPAFKTSLRRFAAWVWERIRSDIVFRVTQKLVEGRALPCMSKIAEQAFRRDVVDLCDDQLERDFVYKLDAATILPNRRVFGCGLAEMITVRANGDIRLCAYLSDSFGNIKAVGDNGKDFLAGVAEKLSQIIRGTRVENLPTCGVCDLRYFCGGKCRRDNKRDYGNPTVCECDEAYKREWYERLVRINPYIVEPISDLERG